MFRYRCPQCRQVLQAPEIRAGKASVCPKCSSKITIPADSAQWITENESTQPVSVEAKPAAAEYFAPIHVGPADPTPVGTGPRVDTPIATPSEPRRTAPVPPAPVPSVTATATKSTPQTPSPATPRPEAKAAPEVKAPVAEAKPAPEPKPPVVEAKTPPATAKSAPESKPPRTEVKAPPAAVPPVKSSPEIKLPPPEAKAPPAAVPPVKSSPEIKLPPPEAKAVPAPAAAASRPQPRRVVTSAVVPATGAPDGMVSFNQPLNLRSEMDIAAALTDVLTTRMKPPPKPPRDLYPSTAFWMLMTGVAIILLALTLFKPVDHLKWVAYIGVAEIAIGYVWIVTLAFRRDPTSALKCAIPPFTFMYLIKKRYRRLRPLRFVATGAVLISLTFLAPRVMSETRRMSGADIIVAPIGIEDYSALSDVEQLRVYREKRQFDRLIDVLKKLDRTDPYYSANAPQREALAAELRLLADPAVTSDSGIRAVALPAYVRWGGDDSRSLLLAAVQGHPDERREAIKLLHKWPDPDVARVLVSRLGNREEANLAKNSLINIGGSLAVQALVPLLRDKEKDKVLHLAALDLLAHPGIGNEDALVFLRAEKEKFTDQSLNRQVESTILKITDNLRQRPN